MILVFGSINIDLVAQVPVIPGPGRTVLAPSYQRHFGGKGANQAVAAARIARLGQVCMAGRVGRDGFGDSAIANLRTNGVDTALVSRRMNPPAAPSSRSIRPERMRLRWPAAPI